MNIKDLLNNRTFKVSVIIFILIILIYSILRIFVFKSDPIYSLLVLMYNTYLYLAEYLVNIVIKITGVDVVIENHKIIFGNITEYVKVNEDIIQNWTNYILFKKWTAIILFLFWFTFTSFRKKIIYKGFFILTHFISVVSGFIIITIIGPKIVDAKSLLLLPTFHEQLQPNIFGILAMITLLVIWLKKNKAEIKNTLSKLKINIKISERKINEIIVLFYIFAIIKNFIVPYFNFFKYINFLLSVTKSIVSFIGYKAIIEGPYLIGDNGTLFMAKWCLGFVTMFVFAALVYLTGKNYRTNWIFISIGIVFLHIINIVRLASLFIFLQNNENYVLSMDHHMIYNIVVYILIFVVWIIFFEKFAGIKPSKNKNRKEDVNELINN